MRNAIEKMRTLEAENTNYPKNKCNSSEDVEIKIIFL